MAANIFFALTTLSFLSLTSAHGQVPGIIVDGVFYQGYNPNMQYQKPIPTLGAWSIPQDQSNGFVDGTKIADPDIICHIGATPSNASIPVKAGAKVDLQWTPWPDSHHGPMISYLANCNGPCTSVDKTQLSFFKIEATGLIDSSKPPGFWGVDQMIQNNNTWSLIIPSTIAKGNYVLRHETIALHEAGSEGKAQYYPFCFNLAVDSEGTDAPEGVKGTELYKADDPGLKINIYQTLTSYAIPGPTLYSGAVSVTQTMPSAPTATGTLVPGI
ncbi:glycoside hydrolase family 61 protein [Tricladium varicosporioides]|nr:glycoside hydrolase family 61 protein [Hymenoscyphus varicosporioides]